MLMRPASPLDSRREAMFTVSPQIVGELLADDDTGHERAGVDAHAKSPRRAFGLPAGGMVAGHEVLHLPAGSHHREGVVLEGRRHPTGGHVGVADGLELLQAVAAE